MAVKIRLQRKGKKDYAFFRIVAIEEGAKRGGRVNSTLGFYNPKTKPPQLKVDKKAVDKWLSTGAKPSETVRKLLSL